MTTKTPTRTRTRNTSIRKQPAAIVEAKGPSKRTIGLISAAAVVATGGLGLLLAKRTALLRRRRPSVARQVLEVVTSPPAIIGLSAAAGVALFRWQMARLFTEQTNYDLEKSVGADAVEIRHYSPQVVAETTVQAGNFREALDRGFQVLAEYIFGNNATGEHIEMTAPVTQMKAKPGDVTMNEDGSWVVRFAMPASYSMASLPSPLNHLVRLRALPARRVAALRYRGTFNGQDAEQMQLRLLANLKAQGLKPAHEIGFAGYDAPWTLPFLRRNEAWVELAQEHRAERHTPLQSPVTSLGL